MPMDLFDVRNRVREALRTIEGYAEVGCGMGPDGADIGFDLGDRTYELTLRPVQRVDDGHILALGSLDFKGACLTCGLPGTEHPAIKAILRIP